MLKPETKFSLALSSNTSGSNSVDYILIIELYMNLCYGVMDMESTVQYIHVQTHLTDQEPFLVFNIHKNGLV